MAVARNIPLGLTQADIVSFGLNFPIYKPSKTSVKLYPFGFTMSKNFGVTENLYGVPSPV